MTDSTTTREPETADHKMAYALRRRELLEQYGTTDPATLRAKLANLWDVMAAEVIAAEDTTGGES